MRRIPYSLRDEVDQKLNQLLNDDIIDTVDEPSTWVSTVVCIPKGDNIR